MGVDELAMGLSSRLDGLVCGKPQSQQKQQKCLKNAEIISLKVSENIEAAKTREAEALERDNFGKVS